MTIITRTNPFRSCDTYKNGHSRMMPPDFIRGEAYVEGRVGRKLDRMRFFGLQIYIKRFLMADWTPQDYHEANVIFTKAGAPLPLEFLEMAQEMGQYGNLPVEIWALPEGVVVPAGTPLFKVRATEERYGTFANWLESQIRAWGPTTVCTNSYEQREDLRAFYSRSGANMDTLPFALHDFGMRGVVCEQESAISGAAHLVNFRGSDNAEAMGCVADFYGEDDVANTIYADEHNVTITWGKHRRKEYLEFICNEFGKTPNTMFSHVMDTYDQDEEFDLVCGAMKPMIDATFGTTPGCKFVTRPDSGPPNENVTKYGHQLIEAYGNSSLSDYQKTPDYIGGIQGDGIDRQMARSCAFSLELTGIRADQWMYGSGGGLLRKNNRDDGGFAQKQNRALMREDDGTEVWHDTRKVPKSDPSKASKAGDLSVWIDGDHVWHSGVQSDRPVDYRDAMDMVYSPGKLHVDHSFTAVRSRV